MEQKQPVRKVLYLACSIVGIGYFAVCVVALFVGGGMRALLFSTETGSAGDIMFMALLLCWWLSMQFYLRVLPERKLPVWAKKLCVANLVAYLGVLVLRLAGIAWL